MGKTNETKYARMVYQIKKSREVGLNGEVTFVDDAGSVFTVDKNGLITKRAFGDEQVTTLASVSYGSSGGYVGIDICFKDENGNRKSVRNRVHPIIALCFHMEEYEELKSQGLHNVVCCHINSDKEDNRPDNLEWGTQDMNKIQSDIVVGLDTYFPGVYTRHKYPINAKIYAYLIQGIKNEWIVEWLTSCGLNAKRDTLWTPKTLQMFVDFLIKSGYWTDVINR